MDDTEPVSAYAVYRNLVHVGNKNVNTLKKKRKRSRTKKTAKALQGSSELCTEPLRKKIKTQSNKKKILNLKRGNKIGKKNTKSMPKIANVCLDSLPSTSTVQTRNAVKQSTSNKVKVGKINIKNKKLEKKKRSQVKLGIPKGSKIIKGDPFHVIEKKNPVNGLLFNMHDNYDSFSKGQKVFSWLIHPANPEDFFRTAWEKRPLHIKRHCSYYYSSLLSTKKIDLMLRQQNLIYGKNLDITSYTNGKRETHNPVGRANASVVWDYYSNGCSIRLLNPQTFNNKVWNLCATLQDVFGCFVGANVYLTPPDSQGFAPHYDDIEAFILQLEGKKHWKLYAPLSPEEWLPRFSSGNFMQEEIGKPILDVVLEPGDVLYFPRGVIHQGSTLPDSHSLHITVSSYQRNTWGDLLEKLLPVALKAAMEEDPSYRDGLPQDYLRYIGVAHSDYTSDGRDQFIQKMNLLIKKLCDFAPVDAAADQLGKQLMHDALPPFLSPEEKLCTVFEDGERLANGVVSNRVELEPDTKIKLLRGNILRLVIEEDNVRAYHCIENSREYHGIDEPQFIELSAELAPAVEFLIHSYPMFVSVCDLPLEQLTDKLQLANDLWERGLVMTDDPLPFNSD